MPKVEVLFILFSTSRRFFTWAEAQQPRPTLALTAVGGSRGSLPGMNAMNNEPGPIHFWPVPGSQHGIASENPTWSCHMERGGGHLFSPYS